jgi:hypothetical protein
VLAALAKTELAQAGTDGWWGVVEGAVEVDPGRVRLDALGATAGGLQRPVLSPAVFLMRACRALGVEAERLASPRRDRATVRLRDLVALVGVERYRITTRALAEELGQSPDHVSRWVGRAGRRKGDDNTFREEIARLDAAVVGATGRGPRRLRHAGRTT